MGLNSLGAEGIYMYACNDFPPPRRAYIYARGKITNKRLLLTLYICFSQRILHRYIAALLTYPPITGSYVAERSKCNIVKSAPLRSCTRRLGNTIIIVLQFMQRLQTKTSAGAMMASKERYTVDDIIQELEMVV